MEVVLNNLAAQLPFVHDKGTFRELSDSYYPRRSSNYQPRNSYYSNVLQFSSDLRPRSLFGITKAKEAVMRFPGQTMT